MLQGRHALIAGIALLLVALALRGASVNRHIRSKLLTSCALFAAYAIAAAAIALAPIAADIRQELIVISPLLLAFGVINAAVVLIINPWRVDRIPEHFPSIVQDALIIAFFAITATLVLQERVLATTAVGAVIVGLALQDTLGNLFSGLAIQVERPFRVGQWVTIGGKDGLVSEITWRATKIRTKAGNFVIVPNSVLARDTITNYSEPTLDTRIELEIGASYDAPPNEVRAVIRAALRDEPLILQDHEPDILVVDFGPSAIVYRIRVWTTDFAADERVRDRVRTRVYYAFRRHHILIPYPVQVQIQQEAAPFPSADRPAFAALLGAVDIFAALSDAQRLELLEGAHTSLYGAGEIVVRQGDAGSSIFLVARGDAAVTLDGVTGELARLHEGEFFGEMSLLTGEPRTATVTAITDCELVEIGADAFRRVMLGDPTLVERVSTAVAARRSDLEHHRAANAVRPAEPEPPHTLLARVRQFLRLSH